MNETSPTISLETGNNTFFAKTKELQDLCGGLTDQMSLDDKISFIRNAQEKAREANNYRAEQAAAKILAYLEKTAEYEHELETREEELARYLTQDMLNILTEHQPNRTAVDFDQKYAVV